MTDAAQAVLFNGAPLLLLAIAYAAVTGVTVPALLRDRQRAQTLDWAVALVFAGVSVAAGILGVLVVHDRLPVGGHVWLGLVAALVALAPALVILASWRERPFVVGGARRVEEAEERVGARERELAVVGRVSTIFGKARTPLDVARPLVRDIAELLGVGFVGVTVVDAEAELAYGLYGESAGQPTPSWPDVHVDLRREPSGISSAFFDAAPVVVYDVMSSPLVSPRLAELVQARSGVWVPMIAEGNVIGVLVVASTSEKRAFAQEELALLQAVAGEAALALDRIRSSEALADALAREQTVSEISRRIRTELDRPGAVRVTEAELTRALQLDSVAVELSDDASDEEPGAVPIVLNDRRVGVIRIARQTPLAPGEALLVETVARELAGALHTGDLLAENRRRLAQQAALLQAAQVVTSELELDLVLRRLVEEVTKLLQADAADCYLLDRDRGVLRCAAVHGLDESLVGFEFVPTVGVAGDAIREARPVVAGDYGAIAAPIPSPAYEGFSRALVAPMVWAGKTQGVLGVGFREADRDFDADDLELLEAFASLASLALRNAESFAERTRQARVERGFYRIATLLGEPLGLREAVDAAAQAASEALGGDAAAVYVRGASGLALAGGHELVPAVRSLPVAPALANVAADEHVLAAAVLADDARFDAAWRGLSFASLVAIPVGGETGGLVVVFFRDERVLTLDDLELARHVAGAARGALERSRLFDDERAARALSQRLALTGGLLAGELEPAAVLETVVEAAAELLAADAATLAVLEHGELTTAAAAGAWDESPAGADIPAAVGLAAEVLQGHGPVVCADAAGEHALVAGESLLDAGFRAYLGTPLTGREGGAQGVLSVYSRSPRLWREDEVQAFVALAANASSALANAELYQRVALEREQSVAILANIADGIVALDREGRVVVWNDAAAEITGVPASEAVGRTTAQVLQRELASESGASNRLVSIERRGDDVWLSLSEAVMRDPSGAVAGRIFAFRDISAERVVEQMKSRFVSTVSHELRTPLTSIFGFARTLLRDDVDFTEEENRTFVSYIASESGRLTAIVDSLLEAARLEEGRIEVDVRPIEVANVVADVVSAAGGNGHTLVAVVDDTRLRAQADPEKLRRVLDQLVSNALRFTHGGGTITVSARKVERGVELAVEDEGKGIPPSERERIFSKFYKAGEDPGGTGLGLFIAQGLVQEMGGRIRVDDGGKGGSRFVFELPLAGD